MSQRICAWCNNQVFCDSDDPTDDTMTMIDGLWYHTNMCEPPLPKPVICASCKQEQEPDKWDEYDNVLYVQLEGGYGSFIDYLSRREKDNYRFFLCHDCAHAWCDETPWLNEIIKPYHSHSHRYVNDKLPEGHWGWDYDWAEERAKKDTNLFKCHFCGEMLDEEYKYPDTYDIFSEAVCTECAFDSGVLG